MYFSELERHHTWVVLNMYLSNNTLWNPCLLCLSVKNLAAMQSTRPVSHLHRPRKCHKEGHTECKACVTNTAIDQAFKNNTIFKKRHAYCPLLQTPTSMLVLILSQ